MLLALDTLIVVRMVRGCVFQDGKIPATTASHVINGMHTDIVFTFYCSVFVCHVQLYVSNATQLEEYVQHQMFARKNRERERERERILYKLVMLCCVAVTLAGAEQTAMCVQHLQVAVSYQTSSAITIMACGMSL